MLIILTKNSSCLSSTVFFLLTTFYYIIINLILIHNNLYNMKQLINFLKDKNNHCTLFKIYFSLLSFFIFNTYLLVYLRIKWLEFFSEFDYISYILYFLWIFWIIIFWIIFWKLIYDNFFKDTKKYDISFLILTLWTWIIFIIDLLITLILLFFSFEKWIILTFETFWYSILSILWFNVFNVFSLPFYIILFSSLIFLFKKWQNHRWITIILLIFYAIIIQFLIWISIFLFSLT